jgi:hypothetical protein
MLDVLLTETDNLFSYPSKHGSKVACFSSLDVLNQCYSVFLEYRHEVLEVVDTPGLNYVLFDASHVYYN